MSSFSRQVPGVLLQLHNILLNNYDRYMSLTVFVDSNDPELKNKYIYAANVHNNKIFNNPNYIDAGFDLFAPLESIYKCDNVNKLDLNVVCSAVMVTETNKTFTPFNIYTFEDLKWDNIRYNINY